jgi:hypothetical protein
MDGIGFYVFNLRLLGEPGRVAHAYFPEVGRLRQGDCEFKISVGHIQKPCLKKGKKKEKKKFSCMEKD